MVGNDVDAMLN